MLDDLVGYAKAMAAWNALVDDCREPIYRGDPVAVCTAWRSTIHEHCELAHHLLDEKDRPVNRHADTQRRKAAEQHLRAIARAVLGGLPLCGGCGAPLAGHPDVEEAW
jgi:hypothetical protein